MCRLFGMTFRKVLPEKDKLKSKMAHLRNGKTSEERSLSAH